MNTIQAAVFGFIQGLTEWLPVSSSAHLAIFNRIMQTDVNLFFYVLLHLGTLISLIIFFRGRILEYYTDKNSSAFISKKGIYTLLATIPILIAGFFLHDLIEAAFTNFFFIGIALIGNGVLLFLTRFFKGTNGINLRNSLTIGLMQVVALIPGISRSGITISAGHYMDMKKEDIIMFSMMLALPVITGAFLYELVTTPFVITGAMLVGFLVAIGIGYFALWLLIKRIRKGEFYRFWFYCIIVGIIMLFN